MKSDRHEIAPAWGKVPEAAIYAGVSPRLVRRWIAEKILPCSRMPSGLVLVRLQDVDELLLRHRDGGDVFEKSTKCKVEMQTRAAMIADEILLRER
jgi:hypothetical protein